MRRTLLSLTALGLAGWAGWWLTGRILDSTGIGADHLLVRACLGFGLLTLHERWVAPLHARFLNNPARTGHTGEHP